MINELDCGTHTIFVGHIVDADILNNEEPMTYDYYHKIKGGKAPKNAPTFMSDQPTRSRWRKQTAMSARSAVMFTIR